MTELFKTTTQKITLHLKKILRDVELQDYSTCKDFLHVQNEGGLSWGI